MIATLAVVASLSVPALAPALVGQTGKAQAARTQSTWQRREIPKAFMSALLPAAPIEYKDPIADPSGRVQRTQWSIGRVNDAQVIFIYSVYKQGINVELETAVEGGIDQLKRTPGVSGLRVQRRATTLAGMPAIRVRVDYTLNADPTVYWMLITGRKNRLWQVSANAFADPTTLAGVQRVIDSVQIKP